MLDDLSPTKFHGLRLTRYSDTLMCECSAWRKQKTRLSKAMTYLKDVRFGQALVDCDALLSAEAKAMSRAGQARYSLRDLPECEQVLGRLCYLCSLTSEAYRQLASSKSPSRNRDRSLQS